MVPSMQTSFKVLSSGTFKLIAPKKTLTTVAKSIKLIEKLALFTLANYFEMFIKNA